MKKILIVVLLLQNWSVFAQTQVKLNLGALAFKRLDLSLEQTIGHISIGFTSEYSRPDMGIFSYNKNISGNTTFATFQERIGYGGDIRCYFNKSKEKYNFFIGVIARKNTQKFELKNNIFQRDEKYYGCSSGFKIRMNKHFLLETSTALSLASAIKFRDVTRELDIKRVEHPSQGEFFKVDWTSQKQKTIYRFLGNFAIIYQF